MHEAGQNHPAGLAVLAELLGGLEQVLQLGHVGVRVAVVDQLVQVLGGLPDPHLHPVETQEFALLGLDEFMGLIEVIQPVKLAHGGPGIGLVVAEFGFLLVRVVSHRGLFGRGGGHRLGIAFLVEVLHFIKALKRGVLGGGRRAHG